MEDENLGQTIWPLRSGDICRPNNTHTKKCCGFSTIYKKTAEAPRCEVGRRLMDL
jgi:hypothetical protein